MEGAKAKESKILTAVYKAAIFGSLLLISTNAFSERTRKKIWARDRGQCQECDGQTCGGRLECAHYNHDRDADDYDEPANGRLVCAAMHLVDHILGREGNGLTDRQNNWAANKIIERVDDQTLMKVRLRIAQDV